MRGLLRARTWILVVFINDFGFAYLDFFCSVSSASEAATSTSSETETGPIGFTPSPTATSASDGGGSGETSAAQIALQLPAVLGGSTAAYMTALFGAVVGALVVF